MSQSRHNPFSNRWDELSHPIRTAIGIAGSATMLIALWSIILVPLRWPPLGQVCQYFTEALFERDTYLALTSTGIRAVVAMVLGFGLALTLAIMTGRTIAGWILFFFLLMALQKIPAIAMVHVFVRSRLGIGFSMTIALAGTVVTTFTWLVLHHRARTLDPKEVFALRVVGFRGWRLLVYGVLPHLGSTMGGAARLAMSISLIMVVLGEWQGVWSDGSLWQYGLGVTISRAYEAIHSEARVLASCAWLGILGVVLDTCVQAILSMARRLTGVNLIR